MNLQKKFVIVGLIMALAVALAIGIKVILLLFAKKCIKYMSKKDKEKSDF